MLEYNKSAKLLICMLHRQYVVIRDQCLDALYTFKVTLVY